MDLGPRNHRFIKAANDPIHILSTTLAQNHRENLQIDRQEDGICKVRLVDRFTL